MPDATVKTLCDALVTRINGGTYTPTIGTASWQMLRHVDFSTIDAAVVVLVPIAQVQLRRSSAKTLEGHRLEMHLGKKLSGQDATDIDDWASVLQQLGDRLRDYTANSGAIRVVEADAPPRPICKTEELSTGWFFHGVMPVDCEVLR